MKTLQRNWLRNAIATFVFANGSAVLMPQSTLAQVIPDATLPNPSVVVGNPTFTITGGTIANTNLFHSFSQFSLSTGTTASFNNANTIQNILVRITGNSISNIDGEIKSNGSANLFLINPNGIIFGQNASLKIGGSFLATTANGVRFLDGTEFRANANTQITSPLLLVSVPSGLQFSGLTNGAITAQGKGNGLDFPLEISRPNNPSLNVQSGRTLALVGGNVTLQGANLTADSGRIELGSVQGNGFVGITQTTNGWQLNYVNAPTLGNIRLEQAALADTSGNNGGGSIQVQGKQVTLNDGSVLLSSSLANGNGSEIFVRATELLAIRGESNVPFPSGIFTDTGLNSSGKGSNITIDTNRLEVTDGGQISASVIGAGNAGNIKINANDILLSRISNSKFYVSGIFSIVLDRNVKGKSGDITINTNSLQISNRAQLANVTFGIGNTGNTDITAKNIQIIGTPLSPTGILTTVERGATGNGGILKITADNLSILNGAQISVGTASRGNAGNLFVNAKEIDIAGQVTRGRSGLFANAIIGTGNGGNIVVTSDRLTVRDGGIISASNFPSAVSSTLAGKGLVGNITVNTPSILLDNGRINIDSAGGNRGNINLNSQLIVLRNGSLISTNALGNAIGGNIVINTNFLVAVPTENSDITANAANSFGGQIIITAKGVLGFQTSNFLTPLSDITATSALGSQFNGTVEIRSPDTDLSRGLVKLPANLTSDKQIVASCERFRGNEFIVTGRGGVPNDATQPLSSPSIWRDLRWSRATNQAPTATKMVNPPSAINSENPPAISNSIKPFPQIEAQAWESDRNGHLKLLASASTSSIPAWRLPVVCPTK
ncbi:filamentous hemagglutinin N-terminal domain-containing protein [Pseudanabaena sp. ABRG5-3]|uniref:two-partner secretion domain-containing protein n=1 Tax=Pseudanabaena sp. ABRG5-3 TaxID=685565 RepID=UPI000DC6D9F4|nr:filamentous hemagglutinin N-terminal domain-containing protein [Pseudanabaena sp. ABRG5-3]BBC25485.1 hemagglutination activity domain protein [Pseudanabaena sp. ABRG5-3]